MGGKMIPLFTPNNYKKEWLDELENTFSTRWLGQGPKVDQFEKEFGEKFGFEHCLAVNSGTSALNLAYELIGIGSGDEVISAVFTCTATNIPLVRRGAKIVFADIDDKMLISYDDVKKKVTKHTKAIVAVNLGGLRVDERIFDLGIPVVVDAAQSVGIPEPGGDYVCYSFQAIKHFTTGDGGMLIVRDKRTHERAKKLRWFGIDREKTKQNNFNHLVRHKMAMEIEEPGFKYHMNDIAASMGLVGLRHSDKALNYRRLLAEAYSDKLPIQMLAGGSYWLLTAFSKERDGLIDYLRSNGVGCDIVQIRNDVFGVFGGQRLDLPKMNELESQYFYLPLHSQLTIREVEYICQLVGEYEGN